jgi:hypothetical protein
MSERMDRARLAAFIDGELSPEEAARVVMHLADCPEDQAWIDAAMRANELLGRAYGTPMEEPVPDRFKALICGGPETPGKVGLGNVVPLVRRARLPLATAALAVAASVMLVLNIGTRDGAIAPRVAGRVAQDGALYAALEGMGGGETLRLPDGRQLAMIASFADSRGGFCREFQIIGAQDDGFDHAVACRGLADWSVEIVVHHVAESAGEDGVYRPAGGPGSRAIERLLDDIGAGMALTADEEAVARASGWRQ